MMKGKVMSFDNIGCDRKHLIQRAMNAKGLGQLSPSGNYSEEIPSSCVNHLNTYKKEAQKLVRDKSADEILGLLGLMVEYDENGKKTIKGNYGQPSLYFTFKDIGVNEEELLKGVSKVEGNLNISASDIKSTGDISSVHGDLILDTESPVKDLSSIKTLYGSVVVKADYDDVAAKNALKQRNFKPKVWSGTIFAIKDLSKKYNLYSHL